LHQELDHKGRQHSNSVIVEEAIESSVSNIELTKSEHSLKKPLTLAIGNRRTADDVIEEEAANIPQSSIALRRNTSGKDSDKVLPKL
jgi:hypothetical protein